MTNKIQISDDVDSDYVLFNLDYNSNNMKKCLNVVRQYIIDNQLMIVGGMSIDFALKLNNDFLYNEYQIPDYDVIDPDNIKHANNIATMLCDMGMKNIAVVPAVHKTTMRVQLMGYTVFDSTYIPKYLYEKIPYQKWENFKFIDPVYQKIDQYTSLALLWNITGPNFNIINRFEKDIKRKDMISKYYIFSKDNAGDRNINLIKKNINLNLENYRSLQKEKIIYTKQLDGESVYAIQKDFILHGKLAYCLLYEEFKRICKEYNIDEYEKNIDYWFIETNINKENNTTSFEYYGKSIEIINYGNGFEDNKQINKLLSNYSISNFIKKKLSYVSTSMPSRINYTSNTDNIDINSIDITGNMLSINMIKNDFFTDGIFISNYNYILAFFLFSYYYEENEYEKIIYARYYLSLLKMVEIVQTIDNFMENNYTDNCFYYSINNLGLEFWKDDNLLFYIKNYISVKETNKSSDDIPPKNYISAPDCSIKKIFTEESRKKSPFYLDKSIEINETNFIKELNELL